MNPLLTMVCIVVICSVQATEEKKCYAPVVCSANKSAQPTWQQVYPNPECKSNDSSPGSSGASTGQKGDRGPKGDPGEAGQPGHDDAIYKRLQATEERLKRMSQIHNLCPVFYNGACFYANTAANLTFNESFAACSARGGGLANIYDRDHMDMIIDYTRKYQWPSGKIYLGLYLGMTLDTNWNLLLRNGSTSPPQKWYRNAPITSLAQFNVILNIEQNADPEKDGLLNSISTARRGYVCEI